MPRPVFLRASAQERSNSEANGPGEQVHPSCCNDCWINKVKRTQAQVHRPKGGNNTSEWPEWLPTQRKGNSSAVLGVTPPHCGGRANLCGPGCSNQAQTLSPRGAPWWRRSSRVSSLAFYFFLDKNKREPKKYCLQRIGHGGGCVHSSQKIALWDLCRQDWAGTDRWPGLQSQC